MLSVSFYDDPSILMTTRYAVPVYSMEIKDFLFSSTFFIRLEKTTAIRDSAKDFS